MRTTTDGVDKRGRRRRRSRSSSSSRRRLLPRSLQPLSGSRTCLVQTFGRAGTNLGRDSLRRPFRLSLSLSLSRARACSLSLPSFSIYLSIYLSIHLSVSLSRRPLPSVCRTHTTANNHSSAFPSFCFMQGLALRCRARREQSKAF